MVRNRSRNETAPSPADGQFSDVLTFDGFDPHGYGGFNWDHFSAGGGMARNLWAQHSSFTSINGRFDLASLKLAGELESLSVTIFGFSDGQVIYRQTVRITTDQALNVQLDWQGVDAVYFDVDPAGTSYPNALFFHLDDVVVSNQAGTISGSLIFDRNVNGGVDDGETGLSGRTVILDDNGNGVVDNGERSTITDANGAYHFSGVVDGDHNVTQILPADWVQTGAAGPVGVSVAGSGAATADLLAGLAHDFLGTVSGVVFHDANLSGTRSRGETPLTGWTVYVDADGDGVHDAGERSVLTDAIGHYLIDGVAPGNVALGVDLPASWQHWSGGAGSAAVTSGSRTNGVDLAVTGGATSGDDRLVAVGASADTIDALGGNDRVIARAGDDRVDGGTGDDTIGGGYGADRLFGGAGNDRLTGGSGADVFVIDGAGVDRISDFAAGDHIQITALGIDAFEDLTLTAKGASTVIGWAGTDVAVVVKGIAPDALDTSMFVFGA